MKKINRALVTCVLLLLLTCPAKAGWIQNGTPEPPPSSTAQEPATGGEIQFPRQTEDSTAGVALSLLRAVLALL